MADKIFTAPEMLRMSDPTGFCPGCGHGTAGRLQFEVLDEMGLLEDSITVYDVACDSLYMWAIDTDCVGVAHGRRPHCWARKPSRHLPAEAVR